MKYLLDTNVVIAFMRGRHSGLLERFESVPREDKVLCTVVAGELLFGAAKSERAAHSTSMVEALMAYLPTVPFDLAAARHFGTVRASLSRQGQMIGPYDLQIAAIALANDLTLVTHNTREFARVPDLRLEDWEA